VPKRPRRYSKHLPGGLAALYETARADPDLLNLSDEIALYQGRILELLGTLVTSDAGATREGDHGRVDDAAPRMAAPGTTPASMTPWERLDRLIAESSQDTRVWADIDRAVARYQALIADERKRRIEMQALVSTDRAVSFAREVLLAVRHAHLRPRGPRQNPGRCLRGPRPPTRTGRAE
jgi:hypothetical protein